jgi:hypothetical protein
MIVTKKAVPRRTVLRGIGATLALPLLDAMVPALAAARNTSVKPPLRFGTVYVPNGIMMENWTPAAEGTSFEFSPILRPLEPFRDRMLVVSGLSHRLKPGDADGVHARASTRFLTDISPKSTEGSDLEAGISLDQIAARELGRYTQLASLEVGLESMESAGACDVGFSCAYTNTVSWRSATTPLPMEHNPRAVFERLFGDSGTTDPKVRLARIKEDRSLLDSVTDKIAGLRRGLGERDRSKLTEYLDAVRDVERRIQKAEEQNTRELTVVEQPAGVPGTFEEHAKLMFDLQVLAYQSDLTRVITFMIGREFSGRTYPEIACPEAHHPTSHHTGDPAKLAKLTRINTFHTTLFAYYLKKLQETSDGDGSLLDHVMIVYGAGMSDGNSHSPVNLPILLVGGGAGKVRGGRHLKYSGDTPLANLHTTLLDKLGVPIDKLGNSTGELSDI